jgi:UDP-glucose-4-epimerase GalE
MKVLVTGAAGYIGSHVARALEAASHEVVRLDDFSTGHERLLAGRPCVRASIHDAEALDAALRGCDAVAHLAGSALVPESVARPEKYWRNNLAGGLNLLERMLAGGVGNLVFASTCAVYGIPARVPIDDEAPHAPVSPYGASKAAFERVLREVREAHGLRSVSLRFFNAAGCDERGDIGELHEPETHLIPLAIKALRGGRRLVVHGTDFETPDGTCVRDYVDVRDLARAHVSALDALATGRAIPQALNLGQGRGDSVREVLAACASVAGRPVPSDDGPRRPGDPARLVAQADRARVHLGWTAQHGLHDMVATAWHFMSS